MEHYDCLPGESENVHSYPQIWGSITSCLSVTAGFTLGLSLLPFSPTLNTFAFWHGQKTFFKCIPSLRVCTCLLKGMMLHLVVQRKKICHQKTSNHAPHYFWSTFPVRRTSLTRHTTLTCEESSHILISKALQWHTCQGLPWQAEDKNWHWPSDLLSSPVKKKCNQSHKLKTF